MISIVDTYIAAGALLEQRYKLIDVLGEGASGLVVLAEDTQLHNQRIALKFLHSHLVFSESSFARFRNEARITMYLSHPHILQTYGFGRDSNGFCYFKMEYLDGVSLADQIQEFAKRTIDEKVQLLGQIAQGMAFAHERGVLHRDLKPDNILLSQDGVAKICDFGLSQMLDSEARYTGFGQVLGTPYYMSPEQFRSEPCDKSSDIYSFGILAFEVCTGTRPFEAETFLELAEQHLYKPLPVFDAPDWLHTLINRCVAKERFERPESMDEIIEVFSQICSDLARPSKSSLSAQVLPYVLTADTSKTRLRYRIFQYAPVVARRLSLWCLIIVVLLAPHANSSVQWRYSVLTLQIERLVGSTIPPLRWLFNTPSDLKYPDGLFRQGLYHEVRQYMRPLLFARFDPNVYSEELRTYPLHLAAQNGDATAVAHFLQADANPNLIDGFGMTALDHALNTISMPFEGIRTLLYGGANPNTIAPTSPPPLATALSTGNTAAAELLIVEGGAQVDVDSKLDRPLLHLAIACAEPRLVELMLRRGASPEQRDAAGLTAREFAELQPRTPGKGKILELLERRAQ